MSHTRATNQPFDPIASSKSSKRCNANEKKHLILNSQFQIQAAMPRALNPFQFCGSENPSYKPGMTLPLIPLMAAIIGLSLSSGIPQTQNLEVTPIPFPCPFRNFLSQRFPRASAGTTLLPLHQDVATAGVALEDIVWFHSTASLSLHGDPDVVSTVFRQYT
ncbi:hypothetical protein EYC80_004100 [Monilinia laxa]|uniref:Uncharacterized protein n=1 Tax=Monilinia laxa TaxID=61186 RepID=A0A5N6KLW5_MONLA|nr:hypothetical protein EYC80_004100 [Monilinia laxa]